MRRQAGSSRRTRRLFPDATLVRSAVETHSGLEAPVDVGHDAEAQAGAAFLPAAGRISLGELAEDAVPKFGGNPRPMGGDRHAKEVAVARYGDVNRAARRRELAGVGQEVRDYLGQPVAIGIDRKSTRLNSSH